MNLVEHYGSYKKSFKKDAPGEYVEYAKAVEYRDQKLHKTEYDNVSNLVYNINLMIELNNEDGYFRFLKKHQYEVLRLFDRMVEEVIFGYDGCTDKTMLNLIKTYGWNWFKFARKSVTITAKDGSTVFVVPRYTEEFEDIWRSGKFCLDANEMTFISNPDDYSSIKTTKSLMSDRILKIVDKRVDPEGMFHFEMSDINNINDSLVYDWVLSLRQEV